MFVPLFATYAFEFDHVLLIEQAEYETGVAFRLDPLSSAVPRENLQKLNETNVKLASVASVIHGTLCPMPNK